MLRGVYAAAAGMISQRQRLDVIANNLANINTTGFKRSQVDFQDLVYIQIKNAGAEEAAGACSVVAR